MLRPFASLFAAASIMVSHSATAVTFTVTTTNDSGAGSLRQTILDANATPGADTIQFNIGSGAQIIRPTNALPVITDTLVIDGTTQPGQSNAPLIRIDGANAGAAPAALQFQATGCAVIRLAISGFRSGAGILINGGGRHIIVGNYIGPDAPGFFPNASGIVANDSVGNQIGLVDPIGRNVILRNGGGGIRFAGSSSNVVEGNFIGTDASGAAYGGNNGDGIALLSGSSYNSIGGTAPGEGNVISGNNGNGIYLSMSPFNVIEGNYIGCDLTGSAAIRNLLCGINLLNCPETTIGGTSDGARNVISGNAIQGIEIAGAASQNNVIQGNYIGTDATGLHALPNSSTGILLNGALDHVIGGTESGAGNLISGNAINGIWIYTGSDHLVQGNLIGVDRTGTAALRNGAAGVRVTDSIDNLIGGTETAARNIISGNGADGVVVDAFSACLNNLIVGNYLGTDISGSAALPNARGLSINGLCNNNLVQSNLVSGNSSHGLFIGGQSNVIVGNLVGTDVAARKVVANGGNGVEVGLIGNTIGGVDPEERNVISGNVGHGIQIDPVSTASSYGHVVQGNYVGVDGSGAVALGNGGFGIVVGARLTTVGGSDAGAGNVISGNRAGGVMVGFGGTLGSIATTNVLHGNRIGTSASGEFGVPNTGPGIVLNSFARNNFIGGTDPGEANAIAFNTGDGVLVVSNATGNPIQGNSIYSNGRLGINLKPIGEGDGLVTPNDLGDSDSGPNNLQNFPVITNVVYLANSTIIQGYLRSSTNGSFAIDVYANIATESSGYGEGQFYLGNVDVDTDDDGLAEFAFVASGAYSNQFFTATALNYDTGDTSEFSAAMGGIRITSVRPAGIYYEVSFSTRTNHSYLLQRTTSLGPAIAWSTVPFPQPIPATGGIVTVTDPTPPPPAPHRLLIYRVLEQP
jgi:titin